MIKQTQCKTAVRFTPSDKHKTLVYSANIMFHSIRTSTLCYNVFSEEAKRGQHISNTLSEYESLWKAFLNIHLANPIIWNKSGNLYDMKTQERLMSLLMVGSQDSVCTYRKGRKAKWCSEEECACHDLPVRVRERGSAWRTEWEMGGNRGLQGGIDFLLGGAEQISGLAQKSSAAFGIFFPNS